MGFILTIPYLAGIILIAIYAFGFISSKGISALMIIFNPLIHGLIIFAIQSGTGKTPMELIMNLILTALK